LTIREELTGEEKITVTACASHCGGACLLKVHTKGGVITRIETDDNAEETQLRACLRCRAYRQRVYDPNRLKYPMRRTGERGEGKFERISWDEALDTVVSELNRIRSTYGPSAVCLPGVGSDHTHLHRGSSLIGELLNMTGGYTFRWGSQSHEGALFAKIATFGTLASRNYTDDFLNSRLIIMWAWDPTNTIQETNTSWYLLQATSGYPSYPAPIRR